MVTSSTNKKTPIQSELTSVENYLNSTNKCKNDVYRILLQAMKHGLTILNLSEVKVLQVKLLLQKADKSPDMYWAFFIQKMKTIFKNQ